MAVVGQRDHLVFNLAQARALLVLKGRLAVFAPRGAKAACLGVGRETAVDGRHSVVSLLEAFVARGAEYAEAGRRGERDVPGAIANFQRRDVAGFEHQGAARGEQELVGEGNGFELVRLAIDLLRLGKGGADARIRGALADKRLNGVAAVGREEQLALQVVLGVVGRGEHEFLLVVLDVPVVEGQGAEIRLAVERARRNLDGQPVHDVHARDADFAVPVGGDGDGGVELHEVAGLVGVHLARERFHVEHDAPVAARRALDFLAVVQRLDVHLHAACHRRGSRRGVVDDDAELAGVDGNGVGFVGIGAVGDAVGAGAGKPEGVAQAQNRLEEDGPDGARRARRERPARDGAVGGSSRRCGG